MGYDPVTWRNVSGPNLAEASRPLQLAQQTIASGFGSLADQFKSMEAVDRANWQQQKENNTNEFLNQIYAAKGPEGFKAMQDSGQLQQLLNSFGAQVDQARAREVMDTRMGTLQDRAIKDIGYKNTMLEDQQAPEVRRIQTLALTDPKAAKAELDKNPDLLKAFEVAKLIDSQGQVLVDRDRAATRFGWEEKEAPLKLEGLRLGNAAKGQQITLGGYQIKEAKQAWDDKTAQRALEEVIARESADHSARTVEIGKTQRTLLDNINSHITDPKARLPVNSLGQPDFGNMSPAQRLQFDTAAKQLKMPTSEDVMAGDTRRADNFFDRLVQSGRFSPRVLEQNKSAIRAAFNSPYGERGLVGNDLANVLSARAQNQVGFDREDGANWYAPNSQDARRSYEDLAQKVPDIIKSLPNGVWFGNNQLDVPDVQALLGRVASVGIRRNDGTYVTPSANDMMRFLRSVDGGFRDAKRSENIEAALQDWVNSPEAIAMQKKGLESQKWRDKERARQLLYEQLYGSGKK